MVREARKQGRNPKEPKTKSEIIKACAIKEMEEQILREREALKGMSGKSTKQMRDHIELLECCVEQYDRIYGPAELQVVSTLPGGDTYEFVDLQVVSTSPGDMLGLPIERPEA